MSGAAKVGKVEKTQAVKVSRLQKEVERIQKENDSLKALVKQKDARVAVLTAGFDSSSIQQNVVEAFDMENMFRQAAIDEYLKENTLKLEKEKEELRLSA